MFDKILIRSVLGKKIGAMSIARSVSIFSALIVTIILARLLPENFYGTYRKLWLAFSLLGPSLIATSTGTLYYRSGVVSKKVTAISASIILALMYAFFMMAIVLVGAPLFSRFLHSPSITIPLRWFSLYIFFATFAGLAEPIFVILNRKKWLLSYNLSYNVLEIFLIVLPFVYGLPLRKIVMIMAIGPFLRSLFILFFSSKELSIIPAWTDIKKELGTSFSYGMGLFFVAFAGMASVEMDKWVVASYFASSSLYAIYAIGARKIPFLSAVTASISSSLIVQYSEDIKQGNFTRILKAARKATDHLFLFLIPVLAWCFIFAKEIMVLLFQKYAASAPIFQVYLLIIVSNFFFSESVILGKGLSKINAWIGVGEVFINLILSLILVRWVGLIGPAIATLIAHWAFQAMLMGYSKKHFQIKIKNFLPSQRIWPLLLSVPAIIILSLFLRNFISKALIAFVISGGILAVILLFQLVFLNKRAVGQKLVR